MSIKNLSDYSTERTFVIEKENLQENALIVYEVNLSIQNDVYRQHKNWFLNHIKEMVDSNDFIKVHIYEQLNLDPLDDTFTKIYRLTARYYMKSYDILKKYLEKRAKNMRDQVVEKFGDKYTVSRRVLQLKNEIYASDKNI